MKYLKKVILKNFQSHKYSIVEFDEGLNVIVGPSDSGKSAIIRGIKWALYNEPLGDYYIREGETEASVTLEFSNNIKVKRLRNKSRNAYILYNIEGDEIVFEGFGNKVPKEIIDILSIKKIPLDSNETNAINLGEQLEGAFLLSEKGSVRASAIGRLVGVNLIDDALKDTLKDIRNISINKRTMIENVEKIENELKTYEYLGCLKEDIRKLDDLKNIIDKKIEFKNKLIKSMKIYDNLMREKKYINNVSYKLNKINILETNIYKLEKKSKTLKSYKNIYIKLNENRNQIIYDKDLLNKLKNIDHIENKINIITDSRNKLKVLNKLKEYIYNHKIEIKNLSVLNKHLEKIDIVQEQTNSIESKINKFNEINSLKNRSDSIKKSLKIGKNYIVKLKYVNIIETYFNNLDKLITVKNTISGLSINLNRIRMETKSQDNSLIKIKKEINNNLQTYENIFIKSEICPFCLSLIDENKIEHIIDHYS